MSLGNAAPRGFEPGRGAVRRRRAGPGSNRRGATAEIAGSDLAAERQSGGSGSSRAEGSEAAPLGTYGRFTSPPREKGVPEGRDPKKGEGGGASWTLAEGDLKRGEGRLVRFGMQAGARVLLPEQKGLQACLRCRRYNAERIEIIHKPLTRSARFGGLQTCGSVWMCPVCAAKISEVRRQELSQAVQAWWEMGRIVVMVSYTVRHKCGDDLGELVAGMMQARGKATAGNPGQKLYRRYHVVGSVRALEVTHKHVNGWHPHIHELLFLEASEVDTGALQADLLARWSGALQRSGMRDVNGHGVDVRIGRDAVAEYVSKYGHDPERQPWGVDHELSKQAVKRASMGGRSPMQLLSDFSFEGDIEAGRLFAEYGRTMKGRRQLFWSKGLRALLGLTVERTDEEIAQDVDDPNFEEILARLDILEWQRILKADVRAEVLNLAAVRDVDGLRTLLRSVGVQAAVFGRPKRTDREDRKRPALRTSRPAGSDAQPAQGVLELVVAGESLRHVSPKGGDPVG